MNKIRRNWLGRGSVMALVAAGLIGLGACSSSDGLDRAEEEALQERLDQAIDDRDEAEDRADEAEDRADAAEGRLDEAEDRADEAEDRADEAQQTLNRFVALEIVTAIPTVPTGTVPGVPANLSYNEPVLATATGATFTSTSTGSSAGWFTTTRSGSSEQRRDRVEIFSNVEAPFREDIRDYSARTTVPRGVATELPWTGVTYDAQGRPTGHINIDTANAGRIAAASRFPRPSTHRQGELES